MKYQVEKLIEDTSKRITNDAVSHKKLVRKIYFIKEKKWYEFYKPDDLGDYAPFIVEAERNTNFAKEQYILWDKHKIEGIPYPLFKHPIPHLLESKYVDDYLQGLTVIYAATKDKFFLDKGISMSKIAIKKLMQKNGMFAAVKIPFIHKTMSTAFSPLHPDMSKLKFYYCPVANGVIAEKLIDLGVYGSEKKLIDAGRKCIDSWLKTKTFKKYNLFPDYTGIKDSEKCNLMKSNSSLGFALIRSIKVDNNQEHKKALFLLLEELSKNYICENGVVNLFIPSKNIKGKFSVIATQAYCRLLLSTSTLGYPELEEKAKIIAFKVANKAFLSKENNEIKSSFIEDDGQGDFAILLMILDKKREYKELLKKIYEDMINKYYLGNGLWRDYCIDTMQQTAHSKYLGGVLKYLLCYQAYLNDEDLSNEKWQYISQDR
ncbi:hypothetical protein J4438_01205 [Candidatus Woesearchaeota archaeon]|nr:hypothetical protein [Candidatus Woesearchaeota archaeon]